VNLPRCAARYRTMAGHDQPRRTESLRPTQSRDPIFSDAQSSDRHSSPALWSAIRCGYGRAPAGTLILIFGIIGIFFSLFGAIAWYMGANAMKEIQATASEAPTSRISTLAEISGKIVTIIALIGLGIAFVLWLLFGLIFAVRLSGL
jgi:hypothetical protein